MYQLFFFDDGPGRFAGLGHLLEDRLGDFTADHVADQQFQQVGQGLGGYRRFGNGQPLGVEQAQQVAHDPVGGQLGLIERGHASVEIVGQFTAAGQQLGIAGRQIEVGHVARPALGGKLGHLRPQPFDPIRVDHQGKQVRVGEIAVVVGIFFAAHGHGSPPVRLPQPGFLDHLAAVEKDLLLAGDFEIEGLFDMFERIEVFDLGPGAEGRRFYRHDRYVGVAAEAALFHVAVADLQVAQDRPQLAQVLAGGFRAADVRLADDFHQGNPGAIQVDPADGPVRVVNELAGIFFHVNTGDANALGLAVQRDVQIAVGGNGQFVLRNLISFGQIRVKVVFASKAALRLDGAVGRQGHFDGVVDHLFVEHRQYAGHAQTDRAGVGVRGGAEFGGATAEDLGSGLELGVNFEPDDRREFHFDSGRQCFLHDDARYDKIHALSPT